MISCSNWKKNWKQNDAREHQNPKNWISRRTKLFRMLHVEFTNSASEARLYSMPTSIDTKVILLLKGKRTTSIMSIIQEISFTYGRINELIQSLINAASTF